MTSKYVYIVDSASTALKVIERGKRGEFIVGEKRVDVGPAKGNKTAKAHQRPI